MIAEVEIMIDTTTKIVLMIGNKRGDRQHDHGIVMQGDKDLVLIQGNIIGIVQMLSTFITNNILSL